MATKKRRAILPKERTTTHGRVNKKSLSFLLIPSMIASLPPWREHWMIIGLQAVLVCDSYRGG
jgi:hypothetical protein